MIAIKFALSIPTAIWNPGTFNVRSPKNKNYLKLYKTQGLGMRPIMDVDIALHRMHTVSL